MNRRGNIATTLLVFMTLLLVGIAVFSFLVGSQKVNSVILDSRTLDGVYAKEDKVLFSVEESFKEALIGAYDELGEDFEVYDKISFEDRLGSETSKNLKAIVRGREYNDVILGKVKGNIIDGKLKVGVDGDKVDFELLDFAIIKNLVVKRGGQSIVWGIVPTGIESDEVNMQIGIIYRPEIKKEISLEEIGLHSFGKIDEVLRDCNRDRECLEESLENFDVSAKGEIILKSKRSFIVGGEFKKVEIFGD